MPSKYPKLVRMGVKDLVPLETGTRTKTKEAAFMIGAQYRTFNLLKPPTFNVRTKKLLDLRDVVAALREAGETEMDVWCVDIPEELEVAAMFALNNGSGEWIWKPVSEYIKKFKEAGRNLALTGFLDHDTSPLLGADWSAQHLEDKSEAEGRLL